MGLRCVEDDPKMVHSLAASKLQSNLEYKRQSKEERSHYKIHADQPEFLQAKRNQAQASDVAYRHKLHDYTCDPEQLNVKHAKQAYKLQSDVSLLRVEALMLPPLFGEETGLYCLTRKAPEGVTASSSSAGELQVRPELDQGSGLDPSGLPQGRAGPPGCRAGTG